MSDGFGLPIGLCCALIAFGVNFLLLSAQLVCHEFMNVGFVAEVHNAFKEGKLALVLVVAILANAIFFLLNTQQLL